MLHWKFYILLLFSCGDLPIFNFVPELTKSLLSPPFCLLPVLCTGLRTFYSFWLSPCKHVIIIQHFIHCESCHHLFYSSGLLRFSPMLKNFMFTIVFPSYLFPLGLMTSSLKQTKNPLAVLSVTVNVLNAPVLGLSENTEVFLSLEK